MKRKELTGLRTKKTAELKKMVQDKKQELIKIAAGIKVGREKNLKKAKNLRHDVAQILTLILEKELTEKETIERSYGRLGRTGETNKKPAIKKGGNPQKTQK